MPQLPGNLTTPRSRGFDLNGHMTPTAAVTRRPFHHWGARCAASGSGAAGRPVILANHFGRSTTVSPRK